MEIVQYLVENGADINAQDDYGWTASDFAKYYVDELFSNK